MRACFDGGGHASNSRHSPSDTHPSMTKSRTGLRFGASRPRMCQSRKSKLSRSRCGKTCMCSDSKWCQGPMVRYAREWCFRPRSAGSAASSSPSADVDRACCSRSKSCSVQRRKMSCQPLITCAGGLRCTVLHTSRSCQNFELRSAFMGTSSSRRPKASSCMSVRLGFMFDRATALSCAKRYSVATYATCSGVARARARGWAIPSPPMKCVRCSQRVIISRL
mmetsp:Transcript_4198/g.15483  ORF Transcript_4198/g.15483 Transcript_4198/m.15483 type:complete len:222 (+) Transcript_4198:1013-1678(+)